MARKTYIPTLIHLVTTICRYTTRYNLILRDFLPPSSIPAFEALTAACSAFLTAVGEPPQGG